ncbi:hypothetical protein PoB_006796900, partial [Plakobranchus ocellatus]
TYVYMVGAVDKLKVVQASDAESSAIVTQTAVVLNNLNILLLVGATTSGRKD